MKDLKKEEADKIIQNQINHQAAANEEIAKLQYQDLINRIQFGVENIRTAQISNLTKLNDLICGGVNVDDRIKALAEAILNGYKLPE